MTPFMTIAYCIPNLRLSIPIAEAPIFYTMNPLINPRGSLKPVKVA